MVRSWSVSVSSWRSIGIISWSHRRKSDSMVASHDVHKSESKTTIKQQTVRSISSSIIQCSPNASNHNHHHHGISIVLFLLLLLCLLRRYKYRSQEWLGYPPLCCYRCGLRVEPKKLLAQVFQVIWVTNLSQSISLQDGPSYEEVNRSKGNEPCHVGCRSRDGRIQLSQTR